MSANRLLERRLVLVPNDFRNSRKPILLAVAPLTPSFTAKTITEQLTVFNLEWVHKVPCRQGPKGHKT